MTDSHFGDYSVIVKVFMVFFGRVDEIFFSQSNSGDKKNVEKTAKMIRHMKLLSCFTMGLWGSLFRCLFFL